VLEDFVKSASAQFEFEILIGVSSWLKQDVADGDSSGLYAGELDAAIF
jgi:hypothetical protein